MKPAKGAAAAIVTFVALLWLLLLSSGLVSTKAWASERGLNILLVAQFEKGEEEAFLELTRRYGSEVFGNVVLVNNSRDADILVYFLENWEALRHTPGYAGLSALFASLGDLDGSYRGYIEAVFPEYGDKKFILYSIEDTGFSRLKCFVQDMALAISANGQESIDSDCK